ncbi:MAG: hypothetical protein OHK006_06570 [Thermodesulfovibrionales bacterium]
MRYILWAAAVFFAFLIEQNVSFLAVTPNLTALIIYAIGIRHGEVRGLLAGLVIGFVEDTLALGMIGPHMLGSSLVGFFSSYFLAGSVLRWTPVLGVLALAFLSLADNLSVFMALSVFQSPPSGTGTAAYISVMQAILNAPFGIFCRPKHAD